MIVSPDFLDHWKTLTLIGDLGDPRAPLYVLRLWSHCQNRRVSEIEKNANIIASLCRYEGDPDRLLQALLDAKFLENGGSVLKVHEWEEYNAGLIAARENGRRGGRPKKRGKNGKNTKKTHGETQGKPMGNPRETHGKPTGNPGVDDKSRGESIPQGVREQYASWCSKFRECEDLHGNCQGTADMQIENTIRTYLSEDPDLDIDQALDTFVRQCSGADVRRPILDFEYVLRRMSKKAARVGQGRLDLGGKAAPDRPPERQEYRGLRKKRRATKESENGDS